MYRVPFHSCHLLLSVCAQKCGQLLEFCGGNLIQQVSELVLPLLTVSQDGKLEGRAVQQDELDVEDGLLCLHIVGHLSVSEGCKISKIKEQESYDDMEIA